MVIILRLNLRLRGFQLSLRRKAQANSSGYSIVVSLTQIDPLRSPKLHLNIKPRRNVLNRLILNRRHQKVPVF